MSKYDFLQDKVFLEQLTALKIKQQFIKVTVLNWKEEPLKEIQGIAINGSVNLDGNSAMRRTASLTLFAEQDENNDLTNVDMLFSINKKCILQLGIVNAVGKKSFELIGKDKKQKQNYTIDYNSLYGDVIWFPLGVYIMFNPSVAHSTTGVTITMQLKDKMCLLNGDVGGQIHSSVDFHEQDQVVDLDGNSIQKKKVLIYDIIKELVNHWGDEDLSRIIISEVPLKIKSVARWNNKQLLYGLQSDNEMTLSIGTPPSGWNTNNGKVFEYGDEVGFEYVDFVFPGQLTSNIGDTVTSVLDKIINQLGNYEYFYDVFGNFIFRQKQNYLNMTNTAYWNKQNGNKKQSKPFDLPKDYYEADYYRLNKSVYNFSSNEYTTAYNNSLNFNNIRNDFVVWGAFKTVDSGVKPCRFHLAIDKKPEIGKQHKIILYKDSYGVVRAAAAKDVADEDITIRISTDWREEIYYQMVQDQYWGTGTNTETNNSYFQYYPQLKEQFPKIFDLSPLLEGTGEDLHDTGYAIGYMVDLQQHPEKITYYLDFIDEDSELGQYSVNNIGRRPKILDNNQSVNCVFQPFVPDYIYLNRNNYSSDQEMGRDRQNLINQGQKFIQLDNQIMRYFTQGGNYNSCFEIIKDLLYQYTHVNNTISITTLPIYYLQPNTRITVEDSSSGIYGDYIIQSISLPLDISSTMNINAYKALQKI